MSKFKVGFFAAQDLRKYYKIKDDKLKKINALSSNLNINIDLIKFKNEILPSTIQVVIKEIIKENKNTHTYVLKSKDGSKLPSFRAGQYINLYINREGKVISRPYFLVSDNNEALEGEYRITVFAIKSGLISNYLLGTLKVNDEVFISHPIDGYTYNSIRDEEQVIGITSGNGVPLMYALAKGILNEEENFSLTIFYIEKKEEDFIYLDKFDDIISKTTKVKVIYLLEKEKNSKYEHGFITKELLDKYIKGHVSFYISCPNNLNTKINKVLTSYELPKKFFRTINTSYVGSRKRKNYNIKVKYLNNIKEYKLKESESIKYLLEDIIPNLDNSLYKVKVLGGSIFITDDNRTKSYKKFNYIDPTNTFPRSDLIIEIVK